MLDLAQDVSKKKSSMMNFRMMRMSSRRELGRLSDRDFAMPTSVASSQACLEVVVEVG